MWLFLLKGEQTLVFVIVILSVSCQLHIKFSFVSIYRTTCRSLALLQGNEKISLYCGEPDVVAFR